MKNLMILCIMLVSFNLIAKDVKESSKVDKLDKVKINMDVDFKLDENSAMAFVILKVAANEYKTKNIELTQINIKQTKLTDKNMGLTLISSDKKIITMYMDFKNYDDMKKNQIFTHEVLHESKLLGLDLSDYRQFKSKFN